MKDKSIHKTRIVWNLSPYPNLKEKKRGLNCHTLEDGRRKPKDEDVGIAAHAMRENRLLPCIFRKFPTFSSTSKSNTLLINFVCLSIRKLTAQIYGLFFKRQICSLA